MGLGAPQRTKLPAHARANPIDGRIGGLETRRSSRDRPDSGVARSFRSWDRVMRTLASSRMKSTNRRVVDPTLCAKPPSYVFKMAKEFY